MTETSDTMTETSDTMTETSDTMTETNDTKEYEINFTVVTRPLKYLFYGAIILTIVLAILIIPYHLLLHFRPQLKFFEVCNEVNGIIECNNIIDINNKFKDVYVGCIASFIICCAIHVMYLSAVFSNNEFIFEKVINFTIPYILTTNITALGMVNYLPFTTSNLIFIIIYSIIAPYVMMSIILFLNKIINKLTFTVKTKEE